MDIVPWDDYSAVNFYLAWNLLQNRHACFSMDELLEEKRVQVWSNDVALLAVVLLSDPSLNIGNACH